MLKAHLRIAGLARRREGLAVERQEQAGLVFEAKGPVGVAIAGSLAAPRRRVARAAQLGGGQLRGPGGGRGPWGAFSGAPISKSRAKSQVLCLGHWEPEDPAMCRYMHR
jgi:hypothetical protein